MKMTVSRGRMASRLPLLQKVCGLLLSLNLLTSGWALEDSDPSVDPLRGVIERFTLDYGNLDRTYRVESSDRHARMRQYLEAYQKELASLPYDTLSLPDQIDYVLFQKYLSFQLSELSRNEALVTETEEFLPFRSELLNLLESQRKRVNPDPAAWAEALNTLNQKVQQTLKTQRERQPSIELDSKLKTRVNRAASLLNELRRNCQEWHRFYSGYHPEFSWWVNQPYETLLKSLSDYSEYLKKEWVGFRDGEDAPLIGDPIGRQALIESLDLEMIPYTPEQLIEIAEREFAWCEQERLKATRELGFGEDWKKALQHVKSLHVPPGEQPNLIQKLAQEAVDFLEARDLLTIPELCKETWRMEMMTPERQKVNPYFTGGEVISISFPTDTMAHEDKVMSLRGNNIHFSRATVHHELIPGHHLQLFMADRYRPYRQLFRTPFLVEGWALYWEMQLWDLQFASSPEDRMGMLFWRSHRCARIIFSLNFHLGLMSPNEAIQFLIDRVGHERRNATAEVRRSIQGGYSPLYQAAYMLGGLQIRSLYQDLVASGKMTPRAFHDAILRENAIPIEMIRASLLKAPPQKDFKSQWKFYPALNSAHQPRSLEHRPTPTALASQSKQPQAYNLEVEPHWFADNTRFWYRKDYPENQGEFFVVNPLEGTRLPAFPHEQVAMAFRKLAGQSHVQALSLPIRSIEFLDSPLIRLQGDTTSWIWNSESHQLLEDEKLASQGLPKFNTPYPSRSGGEETSLTFINQLNEDLSLFWVDTDGKLNPYGTLSAGDTKPQHTFARHVWALQNQEGKWVGVFEATPRSGLAILDSTPARDPPRNQRNRGSQARPNFASTVPSPDGKWEAWVKDDNLHIKSLQTGESFQLSQDGSPDFTYRRTSQRERSMGMNYTRPDPPSTLPDVYWSPDSQSLIAVQIKVIEEPKVHIVESSPATQVQPKLISYPYLKPGDPIPSQTLKLFSISCKQPIPLDSASFQTPWSLGNFRWSSDSSAFTFLYNQRGHQTLRVIEIQAASGAVRTLINEETQSFFDYQGKQYYSYLEDTQEIIWMSERDGWNHLYLVDAVTAQVKRQVTRGPWVVRGVETLNAESRTMTLRVGGYFPDQDPYHLHYIRISLDNDSILALTQGDGSHNLQMSPDGSFYIDTWSRVDHPPVHELRRSLDGTKIMDLEQADASEILQSGYTFPERWVAKGRDGTTDIYGIIHRPLNFSPLHSYPVIENIYAGPHSAHVPKTFRVRYGQQPLADLGFIVVQIDGMGTSHRSKAFHDVCWKNLGDAGFPDRIAWIRNAAQTYSSMNLEKVGIYGGSAGGQNALGGLLRHGDFYQAGVADCGCHDNRMDKIWWNELWMGWPVGEHYDQQSNVTQAANLQGKALLIVGELDQNVDPASTVQVVNALIKADKDFEFLLIPGAGHGAAGTPYGRKQLQEFFLKNLQP